MIYMSVTRQRMVTHPTSSNLAFPITVLLHADWMRHVEHPIFILDLLHDLLQDYSIFILSIWVIENVFIMASRTKYGCHNQTSSMHTT